MATYRLKWDSCETPVEVTLRLNEQQRKAFEKVQEQFGELNCCGTTFTITQVKTEK